MDPDAVELRVLGCLLEKQRTTPDAYPLTLNALRAACNQSTNRDPVVAYDEAQVREALDRLGRRRWTRLASGAGSRAPKFRHLLDEALGLDDAGLAVLGVLLLRGPQTLGEVKARTERLHAFTSLDAVHDVLGRLSERRLAATVRRPGWKEERWVQRLGADTTGTDLPVPAAEGASVPLPAAPPPAVREEGTDRLAELEAAVASLREQLAAVRDEVRALRVDLGA